jgi:PST family polysaccharide transporter
MAAVQRASISKAEIAGLFWINVAVGAFLALLSVAVGPLLVAFYREPRLFAVAAVIGTSFLLNGAGAQHRAMLQRSMRFTALAIIDVSSIGAAVVSGIALAYAGHGYWALVAATVIPHAVALPGVWLATRWVPRKPEIRAGIRSMLAYGGAITLSNLVSYLATNADKAIIGRFFGAAALGVYGRAYQLINIPIENLNSTMGMVAFPALARVQEDPIRLRNYFLKGYSAFLSLVIPITVACMVCRRCDHRISRS